MHHIGGLECADTINADLPQIGPRQSRAIAQAHRRLDPLAVACTGPRKGRRLDHVAMGIKRLVNLARGDVFTALDDQFLKSAGDKDIAIRINPPQIAGAQPIPGKGSGGRLGVLEVLQHDIGPADRDFAFNLGRARPKVGAKDRHLVAIGHPRRADLAHPRRQRVGQDLRRRFRQPHGFHDRHVKAGLERGLHIRRKR